MRYGIGEFVVTLLSSEACEILDCELVSNVEIYYLSNGTSVSNCQILKTINIDEYIISAVKCSFPSPKSCAEHASKVIDEVLGNNKKKKKFWFF